jgi:DNA invertase Pin-like site-specific DNA recombinase
VSTRDQNLELQLDALNKAGCKRIFTDKLSGAQVERPGATRGPVPLAGSRYPCALETGSTLEPDLPESRPRSGRSVKGLVDLANELKTQKMHFQSITDGFDTKTSAGRFFFNVMASLVQMERELILERRQKGSVNKS